MSKKMCNYCTRWWSSEPTYHDGPCPSEAKQEKRRKASTKTAQAEAMVTATGGRVEDGLRLRRRAEELLMDLEDRAARREVRDARRARH